MRKIIRNFDMLRLRARFIVSALFFAILAQINCAKPSDVIIIGAGASGIAAATKLLENNVTNFIILEAEGRIGGRIHSVKFGDKAIDLGAQWCHGEEENIVYKMVKDLNILVPEEDSYNYVYSSHQHLDPSLTTKLHELFESIYESDEDRGELTLGDYIINKYNESVNANYGNDSEKIEFASIFLNTVMKDVLSFEGAFSWFDLSAESDYKTCEGNQSLSWNGHGYKTILDVLMKKYPNLKNQLPIDDKIFLNKEITKIIWDSEDKTVSVQCLDGSSYNADQVIFTPSLGVLKDRYKTLFYPQLPQDKINAIEELGIGAVIKVFLHYSEEWWPKDDFPDFAFIWAQKDQQMLLQEFPEGPNKNGKSWLTNIMELYLAIESPNVLTAWFVGEFVPEIELMSDELLLKGIMFVTKKFIGHQFNITAPDSMLRDSWYANPHFRGTYSFQTVQSRKREVSAEVVLSKPLTSRHGTQTLLFAGEATHPFYYSTVHGAIETGYREAERIINSKQHKQSN